MRWVFLTAIFLGAFAISSATAEPIRVRSGEHDTFTRIVVEIPEGASWSIQSESRQATLSFDTYENGFDVSQAFAVIPRTRLASITPYPSELVLQMNCECIVDAFVEQNKYLVLDITQSAAQQPAQVEPAPQRAQTLKPSEFRYGDLLWRDRTDTEIKSEPNLDADVPVPGELEEEVQPETITLKDPRVESLLRAIADASTRGLVDVDVSQLEGKATEPAEARKKEDPSKIAAGAEAETNSLGSHLRVTNSAQLPIEVTQQPNVITCPDPKIVDLSNWASDASFSDQERRLKFQLYNEAGGLQLEIVLPLVQLYLHFGFGAEAFQLANLSEEINQEYPHLFDIASILEFGYARNPRVLHEFANCNSDLVLWAFLASETLVAPDESAAKVAIQALERLPRHLRSILGSALSNRLAKAGMTSEAGIALRSGQRAFSEGEDFNSLSEAVITQHAGRESEANAILENIISENSAQSAEALIELITNRFANQRPIEPDLVLAVEAFAFEKRNSPLGIELAKTSVIASAGSGQYDKAFSAIQSLSKELADAEIAVLKTKVLSTLVEDPDDLVFLEYVMNNVIFQAADLEHQTTLKTAERMLSLGFTDEAEELILTTGADYDSEAKKLLLAQVSISNAEGTAALEQLSGLNSSEAKFLRAKAFSLEGNHLNAQQEFLALNALEDAAAAAWLSENWGELIDENDPTFGQSLSMIQEEVSDIQVQDEMLTQTSDALRSSENARATIAELLSKTRMAY